ncbi:uncharacterized protein LOC119662063 [Teleopsis dalmanni]|uniref:uncharacterized protein LOC119662063 n=1 Tax=Teleopsis dalmanni TaxID=139649 RepID=UPI0018CE6F87|nr:uncharacterized protein LOC119662063 [Teleopsis dalmanni]
MFKLLVHFTRTFVTGNACNTKLYLFAGGFNKCRGCRDEERYFAEKDKQQLDNIRIHGLPSMDKKYDCPTEELEEAVSKSIPGQWLRGSCHNKHKNCAEEAYFLSENQHCLDKFKANRTQDKSVDNSSIEEDVPLTT